MNSSSVVPTFKISAISLVPSEGSIAVDNTTISASISENSLLRVSSTRTIKLPFLLTTSPGLPRMNLTPLACVCL